MSAFFLKLLIKLWSWIFAAVMLFCPGAALSGAAIQPLDPAALRLNFSVLADTHIESYTMFRFQYLRSAMKDIARAPVRSDALVLLGDNTMNGQCTEYMMLYGILAAHNKSAHTLVAMGNHDLNPSTYTYEAALRRHNLFYNAYTGAQNEKPYYAREIGGYTFIVLGSEGAGDTDRSYVSPAQLQWLDGTLAGAAQPGKPIFVFHHQPFNDKVHFPDAHPNRPDGDYWYNLSGFTTGTCSDGLFSVLKKYDNVIYFYGHLHATLGICETEGVTLANVYPFTELPGGNGMYVEVYEDRVVLRGRQYALGEWNTDHAAYTVDLK
ncbi:MAG: metallophosphoesterase [Oscillospiraceae bacterium]|nr:metallophosphoesterase [Oscillospiraceae bacterium]MCL1952421.1 metallophosphoesterase [Oscillospiraceae bacterium]